MKPRTTGLAGKDLVKRSEKLSLKPYICPAGKLTIGWGHVILPNEEYLKTGITEEKANELLTSDLKDAEDAVNTYVTVYLCQHQFDALVSFVFNLGAGALEESTLLRLLNDGHYEEAPTQLLRWNKARNPKTGEREVLPGLTKRRAEEASLFGDA